MKKRIAMLLALFLLTGAQAEEWIAIAPNAGVPAAETADAAYPRTLTCGDRGYDEAALIAALLGADYETEPRTEWSYADEYTEPKQGRKPWEYCHVTVYDESGELCYYDPWVAGERGGEYEAPRMNMTVQESTLLARALTENILGPEFTAHPGTWRQIRERWSYAGRWMTESEYAAFMKEKKTHYILFEHLSAAGIAILDEMLLVNVGVNGLGGLNLKWHEFTESAETARVMPLQEAIQMANSTREAKTTLLAAQIVYSNWVTEGKGRPDEYNLGWFLITSAGNYFVDCVENAHVCDSYEY